MATRPETVAQFKAWLLHNEPEIAAQALALAVAEPETVSNFTAWVAAEREAVVKFMARSLKKT